MKVLTLAFATALLCGCITVNTGSGEVIRSAYTFDPPTAITEGWVRIATEDFTLTTDLAPDQAQRAAQLLAQSLTGLRALFGKAPKVAPVNLNVYVMRDGLEFERRFGPMTWGLAFSKGGQAIICMYGAPDRWFVRQGIANEQKDSVLQHELAHVVLRSYFQKQPQWFAEGLAQYLETFRWDDAQTVRFGEPATSAYLNYQNTRSLSVAQMLQWETLAQRETEVRGMYGLSWAFVHFALNRFPREFGLYMATLAQGGPQEAWERSFAPIAKTLDLDKAIFTYMQVGGYKVRLVKVPMAAAVAASMSALSAPELEQLKVIFDEVEERMRDKNGT